MNIESCLEGPSDFTQVYAPSLSQILLHLSSFRQVFVQPDYEDLQQVKTLQLPKLHELS